MKKLFLSIALLFFLQISFSQTMYFKGEWTTKSKTELFTGLFKISIQKNGSVSGDLLWTYISTDSTDGNLLAMYQGKKGKKAIEFVEGYYDAVTHDMTFAGMKRNDPDNIIGTDKYILKLSRDGTILYGTTSYNESNAGMFYGQKVNAASAQKEFATAKSKLPVGE
jgi:hypothetical protein